MALQTTGPISLGNIQAEFGGSNPAPLSEYYYNGTRVKTTNNGKIPASGINKFSNYRGAATGILADYLVVGGGGGAGTNANFSLGGGGGGGGGGFVSGSMLLNTTTVIVGAGGAGGFRKEGVIITRTSYIQGSVSGGKAGSDSKLGDIVAEGGGGGGSCSYKWFISARGSSIEYSRAAGTAGTSGGSGGGGSNTGQAGGAGTSGQGFAGGGGTSNGGNCTSGGGGGGAGGAGQAWRSTQGHFGDTAKGGLGKQWLNGVFYAAGGHSSHGQWSGGTLCDRRPPAGNPGGGGSISNGGVNTGGGAGSGTINPGYSGGSGIVIIRYPGTVAKASGGTVTISGGYVYHTFTSNGVFTL